MRRSAETPRERRIRLTLSHAHARKTDHLRMVHGSGDPDCVCELARTYFAKRRALGCDCRKRRRGNPKVDSGMCKSGRRGRVIRWRQQARKVRTLAQTGRLSR